MNEAIRPLALLGRSLSLARASLGRTLPSAVVCLLPYSACQVAIVRGYLPGSVAAWILLGFVLRYLLLQVLIQRLAPRLADEPAGAPPGVSIATLGLRMFLGLLLVAILPVLGFGLVAGLLNLGGVPGATFVAGVAVWLGFGFIYARTFVAPVALALTGSSGEAAVERAIFLSTGSRWRVLVVVLPIAFADFVFQSVVWRLPGGSWPLAASFAGTVLAGVLHAAACVVVYQALRRRLEGEPVGRVAEVFA